MYNGFTRTTPQEQKQSNELQAVLAILAEQPNNLYWRRRLASLLGGYGPAATALAGLFAAGRVCFAADLKAPARRPIEYGRGMLRTEVHLGYVPAEEAGR